jgi:hypothetical protein
MITKLPASSSLLLSRRHHALSSPEEAAAEPNERAGLWTGTREGFVATVIAVVAALIFGGAAGAWFASDPSLGMPQWLRIALGTIAMASLVSLTGSLMAGRNAIFWGVGMPLLVYVAGSFCAFISAHAGASLFLLGAPLFCGLAIASGVMTAFVVDRDR